VARLRRGSQSQRALVDAAGASLLGQPARRVQQGDRFVTRHVRVAAQRALRSGQVDSCGRGLQQVDRLHKVVEAAPEFAQQTQ